MTGHGRGAAERGGERATVEVRTVNHRYLDVKWRGAAVEPALEDRLLGELKKRVERGACAISVRVEGQGAADAGVRVDLDLAGRVHAALAQLGEKLGLAGGVPLELVASQPGVLSVGERSSEGEAAVAALGAALDELAAMREREGKALAADLLARLDHLGALAGEIETLARTAPAEHARRLEERLARLLGQLQPATAAQLPALDDARLRQELAVFADRVDVTEELVRLRSHLEQTRALCAQAGAVGRRLDFLVQELGREINTIGSKAQSAEITRRIVEAKAELEKIREQVQNVE
jgi:uncharacterized protein (TIGR00255 family)